MSGTFETFLALFEQDKRDVFEAAGPNHCRDRLLRTTSASRNGSPLM